MKLKIKPKQKSKSSSPGSTQEKAKLGMRDYRAEMRKKGWKTFYLFCPPKVYNDLKEYAHTLAEKYRSA